MPWELSRTQQLANILMYQQFSVFPKCLIKNDRIEYNEIEPKVVEYIIDRGCWTPLHVSHPRESRLLLSSGELRRAERRVMRQAVI